VLPDFSLESWLTNKAYATGAVLEQHVIDVLLRELGIIDYLSDTPCDVSTKGWLSTGTLKLCL